ncbi:hypothetical protein V1477_007015 [Vespula maculifrons]|uniref:Uncharacterized protein n=1 Tax=Vespula maculifrons TaxID=7453 RepID=A0ABD2CHC0_VESMC
MQSLESVFVRKVICFFNSRTDCTYKKSVHHGRGSRPTSMSTYLMFNQLQIVHPQFRPKSRSSVLEPSQNFLSVVVRARSKEEAMCRRGPHKLWLKRATIRLLSYFRKFYRTLRKWLLLGDRWTYHRGIFTRKKGMSPCFRTRMIGKTLTRVTAGTRLHDRSCLEMFEADGVDSGAICKRGFIHLQFAEKPEAPEAEKHLGSRILDPWVPKCSNLHAVGPGSVILVDTSKFYGIQVLSSKWLHISKNFPKSFLFRSSLDLSSWDLYTEELYSRKGMSPCFRTRMIGKTLTRVTAGTRVGVRDREIKSYRGLRFDL